MSTPMLTPTPTLSVDARRGRRGHRCGRSRRRTASAVPGRVDGGPLAPVRRRRDRGPRALRRDDHLESSPGAQTEPGRSAIRTRPRCCPAPRAAAGSPARRRRGRRRPRGRPVGRPSPTAADDRCGRRGRHPRTGRRVRDHQDHRPADRRAGTLDQRRSDRSRGHAERRDVGPRHGPDHRRADALRGPGRDDRQEAHLEGRADPARHHGGLTPPPRLSGDRRHRRSPAPAADGAPAAQQQRLRLTGGAAPGDVVRQPGGGRAGVRLRGPLPGRLRDDRRLDLRGPSRRRGRRPGGRGDDPGAGRLHHRVPDRRPGSDGTDRRRDRRRQTRQGRHRQAGGRGGRIRGGHPVPGRRWRLLRRAGGPGRSAAAGWRPARVPRLG